MVSGLGLRGWGRMPGALSVFWAHMLEVNELITVMSAYSSSAKQFRIYSKGSRLVIKMARLRFRFRV